MLFLNKKFDTITITLTIHKYGPIIQYTQELLKPNKKTLIKKWANRHLIKEDTQIRNKHMKRSSPSNCYQGIANTKMR